jgi:hypothetical protein
MAVDAARTAATSTDVTSADVTMSPRPAGRHARMVRFNQPAEPAVGNTRGSG